MQITSLELAKKLKSAGYPQEHSGFFYILKEKGVYDIVFQPLQVYVDDDIAAPTADEILDSLPGRIAGNYYRLFIIRTMLEDEYKWEIIYQPDAEYKEMFVSRISKNLADAAAKMWLFLI